MLPSTPFYSISSSLIVRCHGRRPQHSVRAELEMSVRKPVVHLVFMNGSVRLSAREAIPPGTYVSYLDPQDAREWGISPETVLRLLDPSATEPECIWESVSTTELTLRDRLGLARYVSCDTTDAEVNVTWVCEPDIVLDVVDERNEVVFSAPYWWLRTVTRILPGQYIICSHGKFQNSDDLSPDSRQDAPSDHNSSKRKRLSPVHYQPQHDPEPEEGDIVDENEAIHVTMDNRRKGTNLRRNDCAQKRKWVELDPNSDWWEWPSFPLNTKHIMNRQGGISEPMQRSYALQFGIRFSLAGIDNSTSPRSSGFVHKIRSCGAPAKHFYLSGSHVGKFHLPPQPSQTGSTWRRAKPNCSQVTVLTESLAAEQLLSLLPEHCTQWPQLLQENAVSLMTFTADSVSTHDRTANRYMIVLLSGSAVAVWTTKPLYDLTLKARAYK